MSGAQGWRPLGRFRPRQTYTYAAGPLVGDHFDLAHEAAIVESGVREVFTPHQPVKPGEALAGRRKEVGNLIAVLNTPGQHALLYGSRGVGKSSLANAVTHAFLQATTVEQQFFRHRCDHADTFESIFAGPLLAAGVDVGLVEYTTQRSVTGKAEFSHAGLTLGREQQRGVETTHRPGGVVGAAEAARRLARLRGFVLIDELDVVADGTTRRKIAELIKHLSDEAAGFKLMLVGIAETAAGLTDAHPSAQRALRETNLKPMDEEDLSRIVRTGGDALRLEFDEEVVRRIARLSAGYPHFTHLLALKCAENAIRAGRSRIDPSVLPLAMTTAVEDAEETLRTSYSESIRSQSDSYRAVLVAAASLDADEFTTTQLRAALGGRDPAGPLRRLAAADGRSVLRRTARGVYRFTDPRMRSYIRIFDPL
ncbi:AAA family ATPase [Saccharothrix algeriensis]|uniref:Cdc6-like AAA superfamily ATPase n=1 Tax=Saccharothrix algeriensis TaxID=173560 RepID=A0ABS2SFM1_9PSEU|nr:AAA family ATPase [Saccharothrix algeriensis]MBM7815067.1 Cdc6-like AAA superfamily ATPase [Saccharothrix algeriensis]